MRWFDNQVTINRVRALCQDVGLKVCFYEPGVNKTPCVKSNKEMWLNQPSLNWDEKTMLRWESECYHEVGHATSENKGLFDLVEDKGISQNNSLGLALNVFADLKQEHEQSGKYRGRDRVMDKVTDKFGEDLVQPGKVLHKKTIEKAVAAGNISQQEADFLQTLTAYLFVKDSEYKPSCEKHVPKIIENLTPNAKKYLDAAMQMGDDLSPFNQSDEEIWNRTLKFLDLCEIDSEEEVQKAQQQAEQEQAGGEEGGGEGEEGTLMGMGKGVVQHLHSDEYMDQKTGKSDKTGVGSSEEEGFVTMHDEFSARGSYEPSWTGYIPSDWSKMSVEDLASKPAASAPSVMISETVESGKFLGTKVRKHLQSLAQTRYEHGKKSGKFGRNLHRATMANSGGYQQKIFKKKRDTISTDVSISLVVDASGSMAGDKYVKASASAIIMSQVCTQLQIPHEIVTFTELSSHGEPYLYHCVVKSFQSRHTEDQLNSNLTKAGKTMSNNLDGESIMWAAMRLIKQPTSRRIMIVFSDGYPAAFRPGAAACTKQIVQELEKRRDMEIYGIGIESDAVSTFYKDHAVIEDSSELEEALLTVIKTKIINGGQ